ncbi:MAG: FumA C-terminus/TtdB family hydratase beta subunit [Elusimicrobiota bacterium]
MKEYTVDKLIAGISGLKAGDKILLSGTIYTARDAAHARIAAGTDAGSVLALLKGSVIYYCGPAPAKPGNAVGACGPTTSSRMDGHTPMMLELGVKAFIGKGARSQAVKDALKRYKAVYLVATGGVAALLAGKVRKCEVAAFEDLGPEAIYRMDVVDFPVIVAIDANGNDIFLNK